MKNLGVIIAISIIISLLCVSAIGTSTSFTQFVSGDFWSFNSGTVVLNDSSWNVNIGQNESTGLKFKVNGNGLESQFNNSMLVLKSGDIDNNMLMFLSENTLVSAIFKMSFGIQNTLRLINDQNVETFNINMSTNIDENLYVSGNTELNKDVLCDNNLTAYGNISSYSYSGYGIIPLGGTISWCNHIGTVILNIPDGFWVCNGSTINDINSIFDGQPSPNMTNRFIRGSNNLRSGNIGGNNSIVLTDNNMYHSHTYTRYSGRTLCSNTGIGTYWLGSSTIATSNLGVAPRIAFDNQPEFYDMVVLVRIK